jgi:hypothetical protein
MHTLRIYAMPWDGYVALAVECQIIPRVVFPGAYMHASIGTNYALLSVE